jgi:hydroxymethylpyrimidine/phosphomethylpyrimidine kinase
MGDTNLNIMKYVLAIAGSDSCGGAGIQADIKTITALGAHALTAITAVTAQNSMGVAAVHEVPEEIISMQIETTADDIFPDAVKTGMLSSATVIKTLARVISRYKFRNVVVDPVMRASTGQDLMDASAVALLKELLFPLASVVTPNLREAGILAGLKVATIKEMEQAAKVIKKTGPDVVVTGGHLEGACVDILYDGKDMHYFRGERIDTQNTHGTGCVFSSSLACSLAMGNNIRAAVQIAHEFTRHAIENGYPCGRGNGSVYPSAK